MNRPTLFAVKREGREIENSKNLLVEGCAGLDECDGVGNDCAGVDEADSDDAVPELLQRVVREEEAPLAGIALILTESNVVAVDIILHEEAIK